MPHEFESRQTIHPNQVDFYREQTRIVEEVLHMTIEELSANFERLKAVEKIIQEIIQWRQDSP